MNRKFSLLFATLTLASVCAHAGVKVTSLDFKVNGNNRTLTVALEGASNELPDIRVKGNTIEVILSGAEPFAAISKNVRGADLFANVLNGKAIIKAQLPYIIDADKVSLSGKKSEIEVIFPKGEVAAAVEKPASTTAKTSVTSAPAAKRAAKTAAKAAAPEAAAKTAIAKDAPIKVSKDLLNEDYLNKLMKEDGAKDNTAAAKTKVNKDEIKLKQAAPAKAAEAAAAPVKKDDGFSFAGYAVKFTVFLAMVLGLFYGIVQLLKKGVFNRGKLGFLNNHQMIQVLSTTYVSPKKSLMIVKAHKQLFLVANSESGLQFLSEMKDTSGLIKEGEKIVTGENFDLNLASLVSNEAAPDFNLKENIMESNPVAEESKLSKIATAKDIVKFSDELKKKAKKLKPIEFN